MRDQILQAALTLLRTKGVKGFSQPQVARLAGIPQGHLTYYFPRKSDLLAAVARHFQEDAQRELALVAEQTARGEGPGREAASAFLGLLIGDLERTRTTLGLVVESETDEALRKKLQETVEGGRPALAGLFGLPTEDPALDLVLAVLWGLQLQQLLFRPSPERTAVMTERLLDWLEDLSGDGPKDRGPLAPPTHQPKAR